MAGYSGTPLVRKLGIGEGDVVAVRGAPPAFDALLGDLPEGARIKRRATRPADVVIAFFTSRARLAGACRGLGQTIHPDGALWVAWPKKASGVPTDVTEDVVREVALPLGLVDNKVCAIDDTWSGLRLVYRLSNRGR
ncbi:MAG: DUF3052 domain-containing protein [Solirubrobacterales bacterium]